MLDPVLLELAVLLVEEANRVVGLLLHKVGNLGSWVGCGESLIMEENQNSGILGYNARLVQEIWMAF